MQIHNVDNICVLYIFPHRYKTKLVIHSVTQYEEYRFCNNSAHSFYGEVRKLIFN